MKSLKVQTSEPRKDRSRRPKRDMSPNSMKSQFSNENPYLPDREIVELTEEERSLDTQYMQKIMQVDDHKKYDLEKKVKAQQLAPMLDRLGRAMTDLAPHLAMLGAGHSSGGPTHPDFRAISTATMDGGSILSNALQGIYDRYLNLQGSAAVGESLGLPSHTPGESGPLGLQRKTSNALTVAENGFISEKYLNFQVPIMLNPGEIFKIENAPSPFQGEGTVELNVNAVVKTRHTREEGKNPKTPAAADQEASEDQIPLDKPKQHFRP